MFAAEGTKSMGEVEVLEAPRSSSHTFDTLLVTLVVL